MKTSVYAVMMTAMAGALCLTAPAHAQWMKAESEHFVVYSDNSEKATRQFVSELESYYTLASNYYAPLSESYVDGADKIVYDYFRDLDEFRTVRPSAGNSFTNQAGCRDGRISFWTDVDAAQASQYSVFRFASITDAIGAQYDARSMPGWLSVGLLTFLMSAEVDGDHVKVGLATDFQFSYFGGDGASYSILNRRDRIPFADVLSGDSLDPKKVGAYRAQSWVIVHYLLDHPEYTSKLKTFLDLYRNGTPAMEAWQKTIAIDPATFDTVLDDYVKKGVNAYTYKVPALDDSQMTITPIAKTGYSVPLLSAAVQTCPPADDVKRLIGKLSDAVKAAPGDAYTQRELVRAQVLIGNAADALPALTAQAAATPDDFDTHYLLGRAWLKLAEGGGTESAANYEKARRELVKAYQLNPASPPLLYYFARARADMPGYPDDNALAAAENADDIGMSSDYTLYLAELYARRGQYDDMKAVFDRLASKTGDRPFDRVSKQILASVDAGKPRADIVALFATMGDKPFDSGKS